MSAAAGAADADATGLVIQPMTTTMTTRRTYLRVKRRRKAGTALTLRLDGIIFEQDEQESEENADSMDAVDTTMAMTGSMNSLSLQQIHRQQQQQQQTHDMKEEEDKKKKKKQRKRKIITSVVWKRIASNENSNSQCPQFADLPSSLGSTTVVMVDAILQEEEEEEELDDTANVSSLASTVNNISSYKRRRLTFVQSQACSSLSNGGQHEAAPYTDTSGNSKKSSYSPNRKNKTKGKKLAICVLDPVQRLVDESLKLVFAGEITARQHVHFLSNDERLQNYTWTKKNNGSSSGTTTGRGGGGGYHDWLSWCNVDLGNILHACCLWNDTEMASEILLLASSQQQQGKVSSLLTILAEAMNSEGQTPYHVACLAGNINVQEILEAFAADTDNFVYDVYCLEQQQQGENDIDNSMPMATIHKHNDDDDLDNVNSNYSNDNTSTSAIMTCQLEGGIGYWTPNGEIRLEKLVHEKEGMPDNDDDDVDIDDEDSNDEAWTGNDYPDEDDYDNAINDDDEYNQDEHQWAMPAAAAAASSARRRHRRHGESDSSDDDDDDDDYYRPDQTFRYAKAGIIEDANGGSGGGFSSGNNDHDNDQEDGEYDAAYGIY